MIFAIAAVSAPGASTPDLNKIISGVQKRYDKVQTYKVAFHQTLTSPVFKKVVREADGVIFLLKPGKIRWEYKTPEKRVYLIDGEFFWDYDPAAKQVLKIPAKDALAGDIPHGFLFGAGNFGKDFNVKYIGEATTGPAPGYRISLNPKDENLQMIMKDLALTIKPDDFSVVSSSFTDAQGNINEYTFSKIEMNPKIDPELFVFKTPPGVKVILPLSPSDHKKDK